MSSPKLRPPPGWTTVFAMQSAALFTAKGLLPLLRILVFPLLLVAALPIWGNLDIPMAGIAYFSVGAAALFWPMHVWRNEGWGERDYRWSLPVSPIVIDLTRVLIGWFWLLALAATLLIGTFVLHVTGVTEIGTELLTRPRYLVAMVTLPTIVYLIASSAALVTPAPYMWSWFVAPALLSWIVRGVLESVGPLRPLIPWYDATFSIVEVIVFDPVRRTTPPADSWGWATLFGFGVAALCVLAAIWRYQRPTR